MNKYNIKDTLQFLSIAEPMDSVLEERFMHNKLPIIYSKFIFPRLLEIHFN